MEAVRKSKGDVNFYINKEGDTYHLTKTVKIQVANKRTKTKRITVSDFKFKISDFENINFEENGLRITDKKIISQMMFGIERSYE